MLIALAAMAMMATATPDSTGQDTGAQDSGTQDSGVQAAAAQAQDSGSDSGGYQRIKPWFHFKHDARPKRHRVDTRVHKINHGQYGWQVVVRSDAFTGEIDCFISSRKTAIQDRITYAGRTLGFDFDGYVDPNTTWFRADDNPAQRLSSVYPTLYARGQVVPPRSLDNLSKTTVLIPMESVEGADHVLIRPEDNARPRSFKLIGFKEALQTAQDNGCTEDHYVRKPF